MKVTPALDLTAVVASVVFAAYGLAACGGGNPAGPTSGGGGSGAVDATVTITASGVSDSQPRINVGSRIRFTNNDSRVHQMFTTPHNVHSDCPALNEIGLLQPGQSRDSGVLNERRGCGFHDHTDPDNNSLRGQVLVGLSANDPVPPPPAY
jgi:plastocyanin